MFAAMPRPGNVGQGLSVPHRAGDRAAGEGGRRQPVWTPGRHHDPASLRHGLRASELTSLRWEQVDLAHSRLVDLRRRTGRVQPVQHCLGTSEHVRVGTGEKTDCRRLRRLLRAGCERRHDSRAAEQGDELAAPHSITSSARVSSAGGTSRPSACAVLRLMNSSIFVDCWTGRSAGFSPLRIRPA